MLRVIHQERAHDQAWAAYMQGAGKKGESFERFARRMRADARTRPTAEVSDAEKLATIGNVRKKLGRLYKPPIKA